MTLLDNCCSPLRIVSVATIRSRWTSGMLQKTAFQTRLGNFRYIVMSFSLINTCANYQYAIITNFHDKLHDYLEDYVDDTVLKSREVSHHINHLKKVFLRCRQYNLRMNSLKFVVSFEKFLGSLSTEKNCFGHC